MLLTPDQLAAAEACGCALIPATDEQVRRLVAQRRIFRVEGAPFVATRGGGFFETWATLAALVENHRPIVAEQGTGPGAATAMGYAAPSGAEPSTVPPPPAVAEAERSPRCAPTARRKPKAPRPEPTPAATGGATTLGAAAAEQPSEAEELLAGVAAAQGRGPRARVMKRWRAGEPPTQRWMIAGKMRRGRLR